MASDCRLRICGAWMIGSFKLRQRQPDGRSRAYYPSGCVRLEARLRRGEVLGQTAWKDGEQPAALVTAQAH